MMSTILAAAIGVFITAESVNELRLMNGGISLKIMKYVLSAASGLMLLWYGLRHEIDWLHIGFGAACMLFIFPNTFSRIYGWMLLERRNVERRGR